MGKEGSAQLEEKGERPEPSQISFRQKTYLTGPNLGRDLFSETTGGVYPLANQAVPNDCRGMRQ